MSSNSGTAGECLLASQAHLPKAKNHLQQGIVWPSWLCSLAALHRSAPASSHYRVTARQLVRLHGLFSHSPRDDECHIAPLFQLDKVS